MNFLIAAALGLAVVATEALPREARADECRVVRARYAIYVNNDALWVVGSKHLLETVVDALDKQLKARGWDETVVYGDFRLCAEHIGDPRSLTNRDHVKVTSIVKLDYRHRDTSMWVG